MSPALLPFVAAAALLAAEARPVAIVAALSGEAWVKEGVRPRVPLRLFDRLAPGAALELGAGARAVIVLASGSRHELGAGSRAIVGADGLGGRSGAVRDLEPVPSLAPLLDVADVGRNVAAVRLRATATILYPRGCAATLPDATVLRFSAAGGDRSVEVLDEAGAVVFRKAADSSDAALVAVPPGILRPGGRFNWRVRVAAATGESHQAEACFVTPSAEQAASRAALQAAARDDPASLALLAELDRSLGLLFEAREEFRAALAHSPEDAALRERLARVERDLGLAREP